MKNQIDAQKVKGVLKKICSDPQFIKSPRYTELLSLLVEQALAGNNLKGHIIGNEMFGQNYNPDEDDNKVRVYMYNLRKKLKTYYSAEGKSDEIQFQLEKGSYDLKFIVKNEVTVEQTSKPFFTTNTNITYLLLALLVGIISYSLFCKKELYCWESFLSKKAVNTCIIADQVILCKKGSKQGVLLTKKEINSASDYINYTKNHSDDSLILSDYTFFTKAIPHAIQKLTQFFTKQNQSFSQLPESEFRYLDSKMNNLIYVGQFKTMSVSKEMFLRNSKIFKIEDNNFSLVRDKKHTVFKPKFNAGLRLEYAMVSFMKLENGNKALFFVSNHDMGTMATVDKFTDLDFVKAFYKKLPTNGSYFNALFKVEGIERTDMSCELVKLELLD